MPVRSWPLSVQEAVIFIGRTPPGWLLIASTPVVSPPASTGPSGEGRLAGAEVDETARIAGAAPQEGPGGALVRERPVVAAVCGVAFDGRPVLPRDLVAGVGLLPPP